VDTNGRTMVPVRFIAENLGLQVAWEAKTRQVTVRGSECLINLWVGQSRAVVDGREVPIDTVPVIYQGRTMVPLRFVAETFGLAVHWDGSTRTVALSRQPDRGKERPAWVEVTGSVVNVRAGPGTNFPPVGQVQKGAKLATVGASQGWYEVVLPAGGRGWIAGWLTKETEPPPGETVRGRVAVVTGDVVNLRAGPGTTFPVVAQVRRHTQLPVQAQDGAWYRVVYGDREAWIAGWLVAVRVADTASRTEEPGEQRPSIPEEPEEPTFPVTGEPVQVIAVEERVDGEELALEVKVSGRVAWLTGRLTSPDRLYVDLSPALLNRELARLDRPLAAGPVARLRAGQFNETAVRLVFDLRRKDVSWKEIKFDADRSVLAILVGVPDLKGYTVVLDPGHGTPQAWADSDPGAVGPSGVKERDVVLAVAKEAARLLGEKGATVILTRTEAVTPLGLYERADLANRAGAQVLVSIHADASLSPSVGGTSTYYYVPSHLTGQQEKRRSLAFSLQRALVARLGLEDRGVRQANFAVLRSTNMPSALVELAFISNPREEQLLADPAFQGRAALAITEGLLDFFSQD
jgi:N-acetylmuramoyl-L-alanine amidase